jgi:putative ABC transport system substrate-binding protein
VDKVLRGASPAQIPVQQPTTVELLVNQRTATALGITVPRSMLLRAERVIE